MSNVVFNSIIINDYSLEIATKRGKIRKIDRNGFAYYPLKNGEQYKLLLANENPTRCDAHIYSGKKKIGVFRLNPWKKIVLSNENFVFDKLNSFTSQWSNINCNADDNGLIKVVFKPEAGTCGYGCIQEYDNYCTNFKNTTMGYDSVSKIAPVGPKGENGMLNGENVGCMFGPSILDQVDNHLGYHKGYLQKPCDDSWSAQYQMSTSNAGKSLVGSGDKKFKRVPQIKDYDHSRVTTMQARLISSR